MQLYSSTVLCSALLCVYAFHIITAQRLEPIRPITKGYYKLHTDLVTWDRARVICQTEGGHLAIINSEDEVKLFMALFNRYPVSHWRAQKPAVNFLWLGFHDLIREGEHVTIFDSSLRSTGFERWSSANEPSNDMASNNSSHPGQDCGGMSRDTGGLTDEICYDIAPFICEQ